MYSPARFKYTTYTLMSFFLFHFVSVYCIQLDSAAGYPKSFSLISCRLNSV